MEEQKYILLERLIFLQQLIYQKVLSMLLISSIKR